MRKIIETTANRIGATARKIASRNLPAASRLHRLLQQTGFHVARGPEPKITLLRSFGISCVLDIGANKGQFGRELRIGGYDGKIVSFEPLNEPYQELKRLAKRDGKWSAVQLAIGDRNEHSTIHVSVASEFSSLLTQTEYCMENYHAYAKVFGEQLVSVKRLDDVFRDYVDTDDEVLLKIDTQGFERAVLNGADAVLPVIRGVHLELSFEQLYEGEATAAEMIERLSGDGFTLVFLAPLLQPHMLGARKISQADGLFLRLP
jgi:FkbM family methyltransferase